MKCPFHVNKAASANQEWWPKSLDLRSLQSYHINDPTPSNFDYKEAFLSLDLDEVKKDIHKVLHTSQDWWPADYGTYGGLMIRLAWHSAGTYRVFDGRGGSRTANQRFAPLNSWPDNGNLDKARRLLWPIKQKYGQKISWADLMCLAGNVALEDMGLPTFGFGGGRVDLFGPEYDTYWGKEKEMLADERHTDGQLDKPLGAVVMGLIYVNPEGTADSVPDPLKAAKDIRETFGNMGMNDYETTALVAGGHTFGKSHGASPDSDLGPGPEGAEMEQQNFGYANPHGTGKAEDASTSGIEGSWTQNPTQWNMEYVDNLFNYEWEMYKGPGGKWQWKPTDPNADKTPDAHVPGKQHNLMMMTTDVAFVKDPAYRKIMEHFHTHPQEFSDAFAKAWFKLLHRDCGPAQRLLGKEVPPPQKWQDPIPDPVTKPLSKDDIVALKKEILGSSGWKTMFGVGSQKSSISALVKAAWASASTFRRTDYRGGANGARIRLSPQIDWEVNNPKELKQTLKNLEDIQTTFNKKNKDVQVSMADLIVLGGCAAIEEAAKKAGLSIQVPFTPGRTDATEEMTDSESFKYLEPRADAFRNYYDTSLERPAEELLIDRSSLLGLTAPEMTVLLGGLRVLGANTETEMGVFTDKSETLSNDFFVNLLDMSTEWKPTDESKEFFVGTDRTSGAKKWSASRADLIFGSHSELRAIAEYYACEDSKEQFVQDFVQAWVKVMDSDRFDLDHTRKNLVSRL